MAGMGVAAPRAVVVFVAVVAWFMPAHGAQINAIYPSNFGIAGGATLVVHGSGFARNGVEGATTVYVGSRECVQEEYYFSDGQIICEVPPMGPGSQEQQVVVAITSVDTAEFARCARSGGCTTFYRQDRTPEVWQITSGTPVYGRVRAYGSFPGGVYRDQYYPWIGKGLCDVTEELNPEEPVYNGRDVFCYAADSTPGYYNFSLVIDTNERTDSRGYGRSIVSKSEYRVTAADTVYTTSVHAEVHSVSYSETGVLGGTPLVIKGTGFGFDPSAVAVDVAGVPCRIADVSGTSITCTPAPVAASPHTFQPSNSSNRFPGGRGVLVERYDGPPCGHDCAVEWAQEYALTHEPDAVFLLDTELLTPTNVANQYVYRMTSFLVPRVSAPHSFWSRGDDYVLVQLSADETRDHLRTVSESRYYYNTFFSHSAQRGHPLDLVAGQRYLMEAWGYEGGGGDWHQVAVRVHEHAGFETTFNQRYYASVREWQQYALRATAVPEVQEITVTGASSGHFRVGVDGDFEKLSDKIDFDASASEVDAALSDVDLGCRSLSVSRRTELKPNSTDVAGYTWAVSFNCATTSTWPTLVVVNSGLSEAATGTLAFSTDRTALAEPPLGGTYRFGLNGTWTDPIPIQTHENTITSLLQAAFPHMKDINVDAWGTSGFSRTIRIVYADPYGDVPTLEFDNSTVSGYRAWSSSEVINEGSTDLFYSSIPADWLEAGHTRPNVVVTVNGMQATCPPDITPNPYGEGDSSALGTNTQRCAFKYANATTPVVLDVMSASYAGAGTVTVTEGEAITLLGTGFGATPAANRVTIGVAACTVTAATPSLINCTVGHGAAGAAAIGVVVSAVDGSRVAPGRADVAVGAPAVVYTARIDAMSRLVGSHAGGTLVTITGTGFFADADANNVTVGSAACTVVTASAGMLECSTPSLAVASPANAVDGARVPIHVNGNEATGFTFQYLQSVTPTVTTVTPRIATGAATHEMLLNGTNLCGGGASCPVSVWFGTRKCEHPRVTNISIACTLPKFTGSWELARGGASVATLQPVVRVHGLGYAATPDVASTGVDARFQVHSISVHNGSLAGGTDITIRGAGFQVWYSDTHVEFTINWLGEHMKHFPDEDPACRITGISHTEINCTTEAYSRPAPLPGDEPHAPVHRLLGDITVRLNRVVATCTGNCSFAMHTGRTPMVTAAHVHTPGVLSVHGHRFLEGGFPLVYVGSKRCTGTMVASDMKLNCSLPHHTVGRQLVRVLVPGLGWAQSEATYTYPLAVESISQTTGSIAGGTWLMIRGAGFDSRVAMNMVTFGAAEGKVVAASHTMLTVLSPAHMAATNITVKVHVAAVTGAGVPAEDGEHDGGHSGHRRVLESLGHMHRGTAVRRHASKVLGGTRAASLTQDHPVVRSIFAPVSGAVFDDASGAVAAVAAARRRLSPGQEHAELAGVYTFSPALNYTPVVHAVAPTMGKRGDTLRITGAGFDVGAGAPGGSVAVAIAGAACEVVAASVTPTAFNCTVGDTPGGMHAIAVTVPGKGLATFGHATMAMFHAEVVLNASAPHMGGYGGGSRLVLTGHGFVSDDVSAASGLRTRVDMCGQECKVVTAAYDHLECTTPRLLTAEAIDAYSHALPAPAKGTIISEYFDSASAAAAFDGDVETISQAQYHGRYACNIGLDVGPHSLLRLSRVRYYTVFGYATRLRNGIFEGSMDGETYEAVATIGTPHEGWNFIDIDPPRPFRYVRYRHGNGDHRCRMMEVEYVGHTLSTRSSCNVTVSTVAAEAGESPSHGDGSGHAGHRRLAMAGHGHSHAAFFPFAYSLAHTPRLLSVSPPSGTARGGTMLTITGSGFSAVPGDVSVVIDGHYHCHVMMSSDTVVKCMTPPRPTVYELDLAVTIRGRGVAVTTAVNPVVFRYLDLWSDVGTWLHREPPVAGDSVVIPEGQTVLMDVSPPQLYLLLVQGALIWDRKDLSLDASYVMIQGGTMQVGTEDDPFTHRATITLHGDRFKNVEIPHVGAKVLAVMDRTLSHDHGGGGTGPGTQAPWNVRGTLDIHGIVRKRTWTFLAKSSLAGSNVLHTTEDVDFAAGERLIVTTADRHMWGVEEVSVASLPDPRTVVLTAPLQRDHVSETYTGPDGRVVSLRVEVGLLSRNIVIKGDDNSPKQVFGAHTIAVHSGTYRVENVELTHCGQAAILGRYCTHSHMAAGMGHSYVKSNSIHHSFQRAVTIHGTHHMRVQHNVAFDVRGHTYFVEDGVETFNVIEGNLGCRTRALSSMLKSDMSGPSTFWTSSPTNFFRHNVAAGSAAHGIWFELPGNPHGPSFTTTVCPNVNPLGEFFNNTVHSNGNMGLRIYPFFHPRTGCGGAPVPAYFRQLTSFRNRGIGAFCKNCGEVHWVDFSVVEVGGHFTNYQKLHVDYSWDPTIKNLLAVGNRDPLAPPPASRAIFGPQNEFFLVDTAYIVNWHDNGAVSGCSECDSDQNLKQGGYTFRFNNLHFTNTSRRVAWTPPFKQIFWDIDGSLTGISNGTATPYRAWNNILPACPRMGSTYDDGIVCDNTVVLRRLSIDAVEPREMDWKVMLIESEGGQGPLDYRPKEISGWVAPVVASHRYSIGWDTLIDFRSSRLQFSLPEYVQPEDWLGLSFQYIDFRWNFEVNHRGQLVPWRNNSVPEPTDPIGTGWNDFDNRTWHVMMSDVRSFGGMSEERYRLRAAALQCPPDGCVVPPPPTVGDSKRWSDPATWPDNKVPEEGDDVVIPATLWVLLDINPPQLGTVTIEGKLSFEDLKDLTLDATSVVVWGTLAIGSAHQPHTHEAVIRLHGVRTSPSVVLDNKLFLGNKVLPVLGELQLHGRPMVRSWVKLAETADAGDTTLRLATPVKDWRVGDALVLTPTEYDITELEEVVVQSISADGRTIGLTTAVQHRHFAGALATGAATNPTVAAAVGNLRRNVRIEGALTSAEDTYGASLVVTEIVRARDDGGFEHRSGWMHATHAEFRHCGKQGMEHASILFKYDPTAPQSPRPNIVHGCAFSHNFNYGVVADQAPNVRLEHNVFHRNFRSAVDMLRGSTNATLTDNLVAGSFRSPDMSLLWIRPIAGYFLAELPYEMSGNVAAACADTGFTFVPESCAAAAAGRKRIFDNEAHGVMVGAHLMPAQSPCGVLEGFTVWKAAHAGIQSIDQLANLRFNRVVVSDSHIGMHLFFFRRGNTNRVEVVNSVFSGSSPASVCGASTTCLAMTREDEAGTACNSILGDTFRHVGFMMPQYQKKAKTCGVAGGIANCRPLNMPERMCVMPWGLRYGVVGAAHAEVHLDSVTFAHFNSSACGGSQRSAAILNNPTNPDYSPSLHFSGVSWGSGSRWEDRFNFRLDKPNTHSECRNGCDAVSMLMVRDKDGSLDLHGTGGAAGEAGSTLLGSNPGVAGPNCASRAEWGGLVCGPELPLRRGDVQNRDRDRDFRRIGPVHIKRIAANVVTGENRTSFSVGPFAEPCSLQKHYGQFPVMFAPGRTHELRVTGTTPANMQLAFYSEDPDESIRVSIFLQKAFRLDVFVGGHQITRTTAMPTLADPAGTNQFDPHRRRVVIVMRGHASRAMQVYDIRRTPVVALTLHLAVTLDDFFADKLVRNLALLLRIDESRIKIVNVRITGSRRLGQVRQRGLLGGAWYDVAADEAAPRLRALHATQDAVEAEQATLASDGVASEAAAAAGWREWVSSRVVPRRRLAPSVYADVEIEDEAPPSVNDTETVAQVQRLEGVVSEITSHLGNGTFDVGYGVLDAAVLPPQIPLEGTGVESVDDEPEPIVLKPKAAPVADEGFPTWAIITICSVGFVGLAALGAVLALRSRGRPQSPRAVVPNSGAAGASVTVSPSKAVDTGAKFSLSNPMHAPGGSFQGISPHGDSDTRDANGGHFFAEQSASDTTGLTQSQRTMQTNLSDSQRGSLHRSSSGRAKVTSYGQLNHTMHVGRTEFAPQHSNAHVELPPVQLTAAQMAHLQFQTAHQQKWNQGADL